MKRSKGRRRCRSLSIAVAAVVVVAGCGSDDDAGTGPTTSTSSTDAPTDASTDLTVAGTTVPAAEEHDSPLGTPNPADGEPIKIGYATTGKNEAIDYTYEEDATAAVIDYLNEYRGGIGGRPIELVTCEDGRAEARISTCINEMISADVPLVVTPATANAALYAKTFTEAKIPWVLNQAADPIALASPGIFVLTYSPGATLQLPATIAKAEGIDHVTYLVIDSPGIVPALQAAGTAVYEAAGVDFDLIGIPPGTADMTPQVAAALQQQPGAVMIVGDQTFCISALTALRTNNFSGEVLVVPQCIDSTVDEAVPGGLEGVKLLGFTTSEPDDPDVRLRDAIFDEYAPADLRVDAITNGAFQTFMSVHAVLRDLTGDVTPEAVQAAFEHMAEMPYPLGAGMTLQCNGTQVPMLTSVCGHQALASEFDSDGVAVDPEIIELTP
jgi:branched-chain amino acid transport system substrate-binding protein